MINVIGYVRVSQVGGREGDRFHSPRQQEEDIRAWAAGHGGRVIDVVVELDASGGDADRPGWNTVLGRAERGEAAAVVVYDLSRFSRDVADGAMAMRRLDRAGVRLVAIQDGIDTVDAGPQAGFMANVSLGIGEMYRRIQGERLARTRADAKARGVWCAEAPVGYVKDDHRRLVLDPPAARRVAEGYRMRVEGATWAAVARHMGVSGAGARRAIRSTTYLGREPGTLGPHDPGIVPVVDRALWDAAQPGPVQPGIRSGYKESTGVLRGMVRCTACGRSMCVRRGSYVCGNELCDGKVAASVVLLDEHVRDAFADALGSDTPLGEAMRERKDHGGALAEVRRNIAAAQAAVDGWMDQAMAVGMAPDRIQAGYERLDARLDEAHAELARLLALGAEPPAIMPGLTPEQADLAERRADMARVVEAVWITKATRGTTGHGGWGPLADRVRIEWRGESADAVAAAA